LPSACAAVFLASFGSMALELTASRLLAPNLGVSIYTWTGIIGVVLAGITVGNSLGGWIADRWPRRSTLGASLHWCGLLTLAMLLIFGMFASFSFGHPSRPDTVSWHQWERIKYFAQVFVEWVEQMPLQWRVVTEAACLFFLPMVAFGTISPQATRLAVHDWQHAGRIAGWIYAWSCAGAIVGTFATGWFLIGTFGSIRVVVGVSALMLCLSLPVGNLWRRPSELIGAGVAVVAVGLVMFSQYGDLCKVMKPDSFALESNYYLVSVGKAYADDSARNLVLDLLIHSKVTRAEDSVGFDWQADVEKLGYGHEHVQTEFAWAAADAYLTPRVMVIGGGGYTLPRWLEKKIPQATVDVVEIDRGVTEAVHRWLGMPRDTSIRSHHMDGRQYVQEVADPGSYNLIVQDAVNDLSVPYHIMTKEYNDAVKRALSPDGVYLLTVIDQFPEGKLLPAAVRTMQASFPYVYLLAEDAFWDKKPNRHVLVIAGMQRPLDTNALHLALTNHGGGELMTQVMPAADLQKYLDVAKPILLTDDYAPVDNIMAKTFRERDKVEEE